MSDYIVWITAIGQFFINPLLYVATLAAIFLGYRRVKQERRQFHTRIRFGWTELGSLLKESFPYAIVLSILFVVAGLVVSKANLIFIMLISIMACVAQLYRALSPAYVLPIAVGVIILCQQYNVTMPFAINVDQPISLTAIIIVMALLLMTEGILLRYYYRHGITPVLHKTKRGMNALDYRLRKVWLLPLFFVIPGQDIAAWLPYWPQFTLGETTFTLVLFPYIIGVDTASRRQLPQQYFKQLGKHVLWLGIITLVSAVLVYYNEWMGYIVIIAAFIWRLLITVILQLQEKSAGYAVAPSAKGIVIAAVLPDSPAEKMGLQIGECIVKVNGQAVHTEDELYEALQINAAYCRLEVLDIDGEIRYTQHAVFMNDHYRIGILAARPY
ncbi:membrane protein [Lysinibacillus alkalisoli]|uniref:Membrane protein n=1 Tax=Lysinibacillus alkalisoli TaxID=1911548 RepID=A0A917D8Y9_9BACI|nr:PDZ domain-containing protein [Lysinibacillus alkalisoli]GGG13480.1 membrane protein [Lysinibacillus alkalisoli]